MQRSNPPVSQEIEAPEEVRQILRTSCYDCHSHETRWPWYGYIAPASWLISHDVKEAREHLNFSTWDQYSEQEQRELIHEAWEEVEEEEMPLWYYRVPHPDARLTEQQMEILHRWGEDGGAEESG